MRRLWVGSWMGPGHQKDQTMIRSLELSASPLILWRGAGKWVNKRSYIHDEASIKIPKLWGSESFWHFHVQGGWHNPAPLRQKFLHLGPSRTSPYVSLPLAVHLYPLSYPLRVISVEDFGRWHTWGLGKAKRTGRNLVSQGLMCSLISHVSFECLLCASHHVPWLREKCPLSLWSLRAGRRNSQ